MISSYRLDDLVLLDLRENKNNKNINGTSKFNW